MLDQLHKGRILSRWFIFLIDQVIIACSLTISVFVVLQSHFNELFGNYYLIYLAVYLSVTAAVFIKLHIHAGIVRYSNMKDVHRIFSAVLLSSIIYWLALNIIIDNYLHAEWRRFGLSVLLNFFVSSSLLICMRIYVRTIFRAIKHSNTSPAEKVLVYGCGQSSVLIKEALEVQADNRFQVIGFLDDNVNTANKHIQQVKIYSTSDIPFLKGKYNVNKLVITGDLLPAKKTIIERCIESGIRISNIPPTSQWLCGKLNFNQIQDLQINNLLQRDPIILNKDTISKELAGKRILVTGAAGSIGSEIVRQVLRYSPELVIMCDRAESPLHDLQMEITDNFGKPPIAVFVADIQNQNRLNTLFNKYRPQVVFHAAAYKHVPLMECNVVEAILTNVYGTKNLADISVEYEVEKFVMISTDKAVNPTNIMGASKRIAEIYIQSLDNHLKTSADEINNSAPAQQATRFVTTRFGNVLGSNGSVVPRFKQQIQYGGPVTVTDPRITRFFMTIPEAVDLVMEAASMGKGGEIFIFDMGNPIKITDLAKRMIQLAGMVPDQDIKIIFTGLRPGEKLYEELLNQAEETIPTYHHKIKVAKIIVYPFSYVEQVIADLLIQNSCNNDFELVRLMKKIVPEFISKNSEFEQLDLDKVMEK
ncbi:nucleoside-diphosphate sugar epimerase/dehydratase [Mucilaginibacter panaciglaebae]|uniref:Nucleoside-diphosphate sugar epimerase/dehydratase n=1 Tax=Mucilaginibacter panaciglaebae TaxID=502331 RepID=A0ABP7WEQ1_9SPHI